MTKSEQARADASHPCDACGGTGAIEPPEKYCTNPRCQASVFCMCFGAWCPVCLGTGRISDRMPAADALADAETLLRYVWLEHHEIPREFNVLAMYSQPPTAEPWSASRRLAARAAFRAVPGLRGE